jgi:DNA-binding response OmpR family regulator
MNEEDPVQVFVVADKGQTTSSISGSLEAAGFSVRIFHAGTAVLQAARDQMPTLIIFDVPPLNVDDDDLFRSLSAHEILESTRTIVLSDRDAEEDKVGALEAGADDYITKPFSERELVARVRAVLRSGRTLHQNHVLHVGTISADLDARRVGPKVRSNTLQQRSSICWCTSCITRAGPSDGESYFPVFGRKKITIVGLLVSTSTFCSKD